MDNPYTYTLCQSKMIYVINRVINHDKLQSNLRAKQVKCHINTPSHHLSTFGLLITHVDNVKKKKKRRKRNEFTYLGKRRKEKKN